MAVECVKNNAGTFLVVLEEMNDGRFLCVFPDGTKRAMEEEQLDMDSWSEFGDNDSRLSKQQREALSLALEQQFNYDYHQFRKIA